MMKSNKNIVPTPAPLPNIAPLPGPASYPTAAPMPAPLPGAPAPLPAGRPLPAGPPLPAAAPLPGYITLNKHEISASIKDRYANIIYSFHFANTNRNGGSDELKFEITIDPKAFISKFEANIDGELFIGKTKEKETASKEYAEAKEKDENAILISQPHKNIPNIFQIKTNIDSQSKILLTIHIEQYLQKQFGCNQVNIQILRNFNNYNIQQNFNHISFRFNIEDNRGIHSVNIPMINDGIFINMEQMNTKCEIKGKLSNNARINELALKYKVKGESEESHILFDDKTNTFCHVISDIVADSIIDEKDIDEGYDDMIEHNVLIPRRVVFVIDRSGSMSGLKWNKTVSSTIMAIKQLRNGYDRFSIILFDNELEILPYKDRRGCILSDDKSISDSIKKLQSYYVGGATNINKALLKAIKLIKMDILLLNNDNNVEYNFFMNQIIFITDGEPNYGESNTTKIIENVKNANDLSKIDKYNDKIRIFSFGVGRDGNDSGWVNDLNHSFLKILSLNNHGFYQRIKQRSADLVLSEYFSILSKPVLSNINFQYKNKNITNLTETKFNTLYSGNDIIICGKIEDIGSNDDDYNLTLKISAITGKQIKQNEKLITKPVNIVKDIKFNIMNTKNNNNTNNTERIWAYLKLQQFAAQKLIYHDMIEIDDDEQKEEEALPLSLALKYEFVTPWTSMIVVKQKDNTEQKIEPLPIAAPITLPIAAPIPCAAPLPIAAPLPGSAPMAAPLSGSAPMAAPLPAAAPLPGAPPAPLPGSAPLPTAAPLSSTAPVPISAAPPPLGAPPPSGAPPPPPICGAPPPLGGPPPLGVPGVPGMIPMKAKRGPAGRAPPKALAMRGLQWNKLKGKALHKSVFKDIKVNDDDIKLDFGVLDELFCKPKKKKKKKAKKKVSKRTPKKQVITFLDVMDEDGKKSRMVNVTMKAINKTAEEYRDMILTMEFDEKDDHNPKDIVAAINKIVPNEECMNRFNEYVKREKYKLVDVEYFAEGERLWYYCRKIPLVSIRCKLWMFKLEFNELCDSPNKQINLLQSVYDEIYGNEEMAKIFELILAIGNYLNYGNRRNGEAKGIRLDIFDKLKDLKANKSINKGDNKYTLLMYLVDMVNKKYPELSNWIKIFENCNKCININMYELEKDICLIEKKVKNLNVQLMRIDEERIKFEENNEKKSKISKESWEEPTAPKDVYKIVMTEFLKKAEDESSKLISMFEDINRKWYDLVIGLGEKLTDKYTLCDFWRSLDNIKNIWIETQHILDAK